MRATRAPTLRDHHARVTRERVMAAVADLLEQAQPDDLTMPEVAAASRISLRTIYRHFPTREELLEATGRWIGAEVLESGYPRTLDEVATVVAHGAARFDERPGLARAMALSTVGQRVRATCRRERLEAIRAALRAEVGELPDEELRRAEAVLGYLHNMLAYTTMREENGFSGDEVGEALSWAIRVLVDDLRRRQPTSGGLK